MPAGRPTDYDPEYCEMLVAHMAEGLSFASFGGVVGVTESTLHLWKKTHEEFSESEHLGKVKSMLLWEKEGIKGMWGGREFNDRSWKFNMKNRFGWKDRNDLTSDDKPVRGILLTEGEDEPTTESSDNEG